jgi:transposase
MLPALQIKQSIEIRRRKSDQVDAQRIAEYARLRRETLQATVLPAKGILRLQLLITLRDRLVRGRGGFEATWKEQNKALDGKEYKEIFQIYKSLIQNLMLQIKKLGSQIKVVIERDEKSKQTPNLLSHVQYFRNV